MAYTGWCNCSELPENCTFGQSTLNLEMTHSHDESTENGRSAKFGGQKVDWEIELYYKRVQILYLVLTSDTGD